MDRKIGIFSKTDFYVIYDCTDKAFSKLIEPIKKEIGWQDKGSQKFPPKIVRRVIDFLGEPD